MDLILRLLQQRPKPNWIFNLQPGHTEWRPDNALAMMNLALLAYGDPADIERQLRGRGFKWVSVLVSEVDRLTTQAIVGEYQDCVVLAFRGTQPTQYDDLRLDTMAQQISSETLGMLGWGDIHEGFALGFLALRDAILQTLQNNNSHDKPLWISGHSLGAALAIVAAAWFASANFKLNGVYSFGQPRVGDRQFKAAYEARLLAVTFRCVNGRDPVARLPPRQLTENDLAVLRLNRKNVFATGKAIIGGVDNAVHEYTHLGNLRLLMPDGSLSLSLQQEEALLPTEFNANNIFRLFSFVGFMFVYRLMDHAPIAIMGRPGYVDRLEKLL